MIKLILWCMGASAALMAFLIAGERRAAKDPTSAFTKWWREHIVAQDPYNDKNEEK
jgi:hypothetical protein